MFAYVCVCLCVCVSSAAETRARGSWSDTQDEGNSLSLTKLYVDPVIIRMAAVKFWRISGLAVLP